MDRASLILRYAAGYDAVTNALVDITDAELDHRPAPHEWTAREIVHHLADSETNSYVRLRMLLATPDYVVQPYDQDEFAAHPKLRYDRPIEVSLAVLRAVRASSLDLLEGIDDDDLIDLADIHGIGIRVAGDVVDPRDGELDVFRGEVRAIVELDAGTQLVLPGRVVDDAPGQRESRG